MAQYTEYHPLKFWLDPASIAEIVAHIQTYLVNNPINSTTEIETIIHDYLIAHPELIGGVDSVNGETGEVVLTADNISAGETVTIKDVLDSLQDQIDDIVASIPSDYQQLINDVSDLKSALNSGFITVNKTLTWQRGWIRNNGNVEASSGASAYAVVPMSKGEIIKIGTNNANTTIIGSTTAETVSVGDTVTVIQSTGSSGEYEIHTYEAPEDMTITLCVRVANYTVHFSKQSDAIADVYATISDELDALKVTSDMIDGNAFVTKPVSNATEKESYYYYRTSSATLNFISNNNSVGVIAPLSAFQNDRISFDYDASLNQSTQPIMVTDGSTVGSNVVGYWSALEISRGSASFDEYGGSYDSVNKKLYISLEKIEEKKPTATHIVFNGILSIPHTVYTDILQERKKLEWLISSSLPVIVVAQDGTGDYTTIQEAVNNASNDTTIFIKDGEYKETVIVNKYVHLVGQSKHGTVLYQNIGDYDNCPILITQGSVCNMTIKSLAPADTSGLSNYAYAIHLDKNFTSLAKYQKCEIYNCDIYSEVNDAIGAGTNYASEYDIHDCFIHVAHSPVKTGSCGFKCHNGQNQTSGKVTLKNNIIITEDANGTSCYDILFHNGGISNIQQIEILMVGNVLKYYHNGITDIFAPSGYCFGNSVAAMNTLS